MGNIDVVIPAGGQLDKDFEKVVGTDTKALIAFEGKTILKRTIEALQGCAQIGRIIVVGSQPVIDHSDCEGVHACLKATGSSPENIMLGVTELTQSPNPPSKILIVTCDLPFLTPEIVNNFINLCTGDQDFYLPLISKDEFRERFPEAPAMFVPLIDGEFTAGCMYMASVKGLKVAQPQLEKIFRKRKSKAGMAMVLGPFFVYDLLVKKLTIKKVEDKVKSLLGVSGRAVMQAPPELAYDVDYPDDYYYAISAFQSDRRSTPAEVS